jgi:hypothetical protein
MYPTQRYFYRWHIRTPENPPELVPFDSRTRVWSRSEALELVNKWNASAPTNNWKYWLDADDTQGPR